MVGHIEPLLSRGSPLFSLLYWETESINNKEVDHQPSNGGFIFKWRINMLTPWWKDNDYIVIGDCANILFVTDEKTSAIEFTSKTKLNSIIISGEVAKKLVESRHVPNNEIIDFISKRITSLKEELEQVNKRRNEALNILEKQRDIIRQLKAEIEKLEK